MGLNCVPLFPIHVSDRTEALHFSLLWELALHLNLSQLSWQQEGLWEGVWAAGCHKLIRR